MAFEREKAKERPPIADTLRRLPGQSLREELDKIVNEDVAAYFAVMMAVETKAYRIFGNGRASIREDGILILASKQAIGDPLAQARGRAALVSEELERHLRRKIWVEPMLILPGWKIDRVSHAASVAVL